MVDNCIFQDQILEQEQRLQFKPALQAKALNNGFRFLQLILQKDIITTE
jgi:hypothetical protein